MVEELWKLIRDIPSGKCTSYGELGRALHHPTTGRIVGRWMANCPDDIPWWRVVNKQGALPIWKRDPNMAAIQKQLLKNEKVPFKGECVDLEKCGWLP